MPFQCSVAGKVPARCDDGTGLFVSVVVKLGKWLRQYLVEKAEDSRSVALQSVGCCWK